MHFAYPFIHCGNLGCFYDLAIANCYYEHKCTSISTPFYVCLCLRYTCVYMCSHVWVHWMGSECRRMCTYMEPVSDVGCLPWWLFTLYTDAGSPAEPGALRMPCLQRLHNESGCHALLAFSWVLNNWTPVLLNRRDGDGDEDREVGE